MRLFTLDEANELLPEMKSLLIRIRKLYSGVSGMREEARTAAAASEYGGGMPGGPKYVRALYEIGKLTTRIHEKGVQLKDHERGLIDFPAMRGERVVLLCWQLDDGDRVEWWHDIEAGFAGRQRI